MTSFKRIAIITTKGGTDITDTLKSVIQLLQERDIEIVLNRFSADLLPESGLPTADNGRLAHGCDLVIAIGGDGTMLQAVRAVADFDIPLLGINRGRLGFLADVPADRVEENLDKVLNGDYVEEKRFQLHCELVRADQTLLESDAFNDVIIQNIARLIELETYVDRVLVHSQRADGMIVSSPTGSTAYALSGGGPILYPSLDALVLVPICPHTLSNRPIVIDGNSLVEIVVVTRNIDNALLSVDGDIAHNLMTGDRIIIRKNDRKIRLIHPPGHNHFSILRAKLNWGG